MASPGDCSEYTSSPDVGVQLCTPTPTLKPVISNSGVFNLALPLQLPPPISQGRRNAISVESLSELQGTHKQAEDREDECLEPRTSCFMCHGHDFHFKVNEIGRDNYNPGSDYFDRYNMNNTQEGDARGGQVPGGNFGGYNMSAQQGTREFHVGLNSQELPNNSRGYNMNNQQQDFHEVNSRDLLGLLSNLDLGSKCESTTILLYDLLYDGENTSSKNADTKSARSASDPVPTSSTKPYTGAGTSGTRMTLGQITAELFGFADGEGIDFPKLNEEQQVKLTNLMVMNGLKEIASRNYPGIPPGTRNQRSRSRNNDNGRPTYEHRFNVASPDLSDASQTKNNWDELEYSRDLSLSVISRPRPRFESQTTNDQRTTSIDQDQRQHIFTMQTPQSGLRNADALEELLIRRAGLEGSLSRLGGRKTGTRATYAPSGQGQETPQSSIRWHRTPDCTALNPLNLGTGAIPISAGSWAKNRHRSVTTGMPHMFDGSGSELGPWFTPMSSEVPVSSSSIARAWGQDWDGRGRSYTTTGPGPAGMTPDNGPVHGIQTADDCLGRGNYNVDSKHRGIYQGFNGRSVPDSRGRSDSLPGGRSTSSSSSMKADPLLYARLKNLMANTSSSPLLPGFVTPSDIPTESIANHFPASVSTWGRPTVTTPKIWGSSEPPSAHWYSPRKLDPAMGSPPLPWTPRYMENYWLDHNTPISPDSLLPSSQQGDDGRNHLCMRMDLGYSTPKLSALEEWEKENGISRPNRAATVSSPRETFGFRSSVFGGSGSGSGSGGVGLGGVGTPETSSSSLGTHMASSPPLRYQSAGITADSSHRPTSPSASTPAPAAAYEIFRHRELAKPPVRPFSPAKFVTDPTTPLTGAGPFVPSGCPVTSMANTTFVSQPLDRYKGTRGNLPRGGSQIQVPSEQNTCLWLEGAPSDLSYAELLNSIRNCGRIFSTHINHPQLGHVTSAAKVAFFTRSGADRLMMQAFRREFLIRGQKICVRWNRNVYSESNRPGESRILLIRGPKKWVNEITLSEYFQSLFWYNLIRIDNVHLATAAEWVGSAWLEGGNGIENLPKEFREMEAMRWEFGSFHAQAQAAKQACERETAFGGLVKVNYLPDPCDFKA